MEMIVNKQLEMEITKQVLNPSCLRLISRSKPIVSPRRAASPSFNMICEFINVNNGTSNGLQGEHFYKIFKNRLLSVEKYSKIIIIRTADYSSEKSGE